MLLRQGFKQFFRGRAAPLLIRAHGLPAHTQRLIVGLPDLPRAAFVVVVAANARSAQRSALSGQRTGSGQAADSAPHDPELPRRRGVPVFPEHRHHRAHLRPLAASQACVAGRRCLLARALVWAWDGSTGAVARDSICRADHQRLAWRLAPGDDLRRRHRRGVRCLLRARPHRAHRAPVQRAAAGPTAQQLVSAVGEIAPPVSIFW
eukprot:COSAG06_NODE_178_length_20949_cov_26.114053_16_plen_206_part_00